MQLQLRFGNRWSASSHSRACLSTHTQHIISTHTQRIVCAHVPVSSPHHASRDLEFLTGR